MKKKKRNYLIFASIAILATLVLSFLFLTSEEKFKIVNVVDGDTIRLENGEYVRLLGINSPEKGQEYYEEAKDRLKELIGNKKVILKKDFKDKDKYGRWLRYVYVDGEMVNIKLVREGYAKPYILENLKHKSEIQEAWQNCLKEDINLCGVKEKCDDTCIGISYINWDANDNDCYNLNDEYVVFKNFCNISCDLTKWKIQDSDDNSYLLPKSELEPYGKLTIYTGAGENTKNELYWNHSGKGCSAVWNNDCEGDIVYLINSFGEIVLEHRYKGHC